jgi:hypothetical protein
MNTETITIINPQDGVKWGECLKWLKEERPQALQILLSVDSLIDYLDSVVAHIVVYRHKMINAGMSKEDAESSIMVRLLPDELQNLKGGEYDQELLDDVLSKLEERTVEIEVV